MPSQYFTAEIKECEFTGVKSIFSEGLSTLVTAKQRTSSKIYRMKSSTFNLKIAIVTRSNFSLPDFTYLSKSKCLLYFIKEGEGKMEISEIEKITQGWGKNESGA